MTTLGIFVGIYSMTAASALAFMWGNLSVYTTSYFHFRVHEEVALDTSWAVAANSAAWSIGMMLCAKITDLIGFRITMVTGLTVFTGSIFMCVLAVQRSFLAFIFAFGLACGFATGILQAQQIILVTMWSQPRFLSLGCGGILCFQQIGAMFVNVVITYFINPKNVSPDKKYLNTKMFSQPEVLERVPNVFIVHGSVSLILAIISLVFVEEKTENNLCDLVAPNEKNMNEIDETKSGVNTENSTVNEDVTLNINEASYSRSHEMELVSSTKSDFSNSKISEKTYLNHHPNSEKSKNVKATEASNELKRNSSDVAPKQALKTMTFYALVTLAVYTEITFIVLTTYYKMYGILYYPDDHFFTNTSVAFNGGSFIVVALAGIVCDKFQLKNAIIANSCLLCLVSGSFSLVVQVDKWLYCVCVVLSAGSINGNYLMTTIGMLKYFGRSHSTTLYGIAMSLNVITNIVAPPIINYVLSTFGWVTLYASVGVINLIGIIVVVIGLPVLKCRNSSNE